MRFLISAVLVVAAGYACQANAASDPYDELYDAIMVRQHTDGSVVVPESESPLLWINSRYLFEGGTQSRFGQSRFVKALNNFNQLTVEQIEAYSCLQRAILQHHLWTVFDWTTSLSESVDASELPVKQLNDLQKSLSVALRQLALSESEIGRLPNPLAITLESGAYPQTYEAQAPYAPFLPRDLWNEDGPWVCLGKLDHPLPAIVHTEAASARSAFLILLRLPGGRRETLSYLEKLASFRAPWVAGAQEPYVNIAPHPALMNVDLHDNPSTPQIPAGTQVALVRQALLISDAGQPVLSPLVQNVQIRAYLNVDVDMRRNKAALGPSQAVAEFVMQPREMMRGNASMRHVTSEEIRYTTTFTFEDSIEHQRASNEEGVPRLQSCVACHAASGIHSINSRLELFQTRSLVPPHLVETEPSTIGINTVRLKKEKYSWGLLQGLWRK